MLLIARGSISLQIRPISAVSMPLSLSENGCEYLSVANQRSVIIQYGSTV
jgi:hypothetical protein